MCFLNKFNDSTWHENVSASQDSTMYSALKYPFDESTDEIWVVCITF